MTDDSSRVVQSYEYDSYGNLHDQKNRIKQPYTYTGREHDRETGLYFYRARYYDPVIGRFISTDPIGFLGGSTNLYSYAWDNPINYYDPDGLNPLAGALYGAEVGAVGGPVGAGAGALIGAIAGWALADYLSDIMLQENTSGDGQSDLPDGEQCSDDSNSNEKSKSPVWNDLKPYRGKTKTNGETGKKKRYYEWDHTHNDIEVYDREGRHLGSMDPKSGAIYKPPVPGYKIKI